MNYRRSRRSRSGPMQAVRPGQDKQQDIVNPAICEEQEIGAIEAQNVMPDNSNLNSDRNWLQQDVANI